MPDTCVSFLMLLCFCSASAQCGYTRIVAAMIGLCSLTRTCPTNEQHAPSNKGIVELKRNTAAATSLLHRHNGSAGKQNIRS